MKYIFFGTPRFAEIILDELIRADVPPAAVVCNPDRPVGRKKIITAPATKLLAEKYNIEIIQPEKIDASFIERLRSLSPDLFVVAAYAKILPKAILDIPRLGTLGVHPSLLPKYRGASPIQSAILNGDGARTGATIYLMDEKTDHGPILAREKIDEEIGRAAGAQELPTGGEPSYLELEEKLATLSAKLLIKTMPDFLTGKITTHMQDELQATYTKKFTTHDGFIEPEDLVAAEQHHPTEMGHAKKARDILGKINALNPEPGAWTLQDGKRIKLLKAKLDQGRLVLLETQREGERPKLKSR